MNILYCPQIAYFTRSIYIILASFKHIILSQIEHGLQLCCPFFLKKRDFQRYQTYFCGQYGSLLARLGLYSLQLTQKRYLIVYSWKKDSNSYYIRFSVSNRTGSFRRIWPWLLQIFANLKLFFLLNLSFQEGTGYFPIIYRWSNYFML